MQVRLQDGGLGDDREGEFGQDSQSLTDGSICLDGKLLLRERKFFSRREGLSVVRLNLLYVVRVWWKTEMAATFGCELIWISGIWFWLVF